MKLLSKEKIQLNTIKINEFVAVLITWSFCNNDAADNIASSFSIRCDLSIVLSDKISSSMNIDSVRLGGSLGATTPVYELSDGTLSRLA